MLPKWFLFKLSVYFPEYTQKKRLKKILSELQNIDLKNFQYQVPKDYEDYSNDISKIISGNLTVLTKTAPLLLEPTGGSSGGTKLIPYTKSLKEEFQYAIDPWLVELFIKYPALFFGQQYWSITPSTKVNTKSEIPVGFQSDIDYLNGIQRNFSQNIFPVPSSLQSCNDFETVLFFTLLFLINTPHLRFLSVWHPSMLLIMTDTLEKRFDELLNSLETGVLPKDIKPYISFKTNKKRVKLLRKTSYRPALIWKNIRVISCWAGNDKQYWIDRIREIFPQAKIQPKGLIATEGITSIPLCRKQDVLAICSHFYEFETDQGKIISFGELQKGKTYHLLLTTSGGFVRYKTHDLVKVRGFYRKLPCLEFITRNNYTSDIFGEKISLKQAEEICRKIPCKFSFAMIAPEKIKNGYRYALYIDTDDHIYPEEFLERELCENLHYQHARNIGQLQKSVTKKVSKPVEKINSYARECNQQVGSIKYSALSLDMNWNNIFDVEL